MTRLHDVAILGRTPAGLCAAYCLARKRLDVVVIDSPQQAVECPLADWAPADLMRLGPLPRSLPADCGADAFRKVVYHNVTFDRTVVYASRSIIGYVMRRSDLMNALSALATGAGARIRPAARLPAIRLQEDSVRLDGPVQVTAKLLVIAQNQPSDVFSELALPIRTVPQSPIVVCGLDIPLASRTQARRSAGAFHIVELRERSDLGLFFVVAGTVHLRVVSTSPNTGPRAKELSGMMTSLQRAGLLPADLPLTKVRGAVWRPPAGVALELETHVAKRCLLIGTAGGFADSITGHTLSAGIRSAFLAADVVRAAVASGDLQETLVRFKTSWRQSLAEYLRPPNTSLGMLLPLIFVNQRIVAKFTNALLHGASI
jgi:flavin-dependent dehydrogenase